MNYRTCLAIAVWLATSAVMAEEPLLQLATFRADVTPPIGDGPCVGFMPKIASIEHPLEVRGIKPSCDSPCATTEPSARRPYASNCKPGVLSANA